LALVFAALTCAADTIPVQSKTELSIALENLSPGDIVQLASGEWQDLDITIKGKGRPDSPIIFEAAEPGKSILTGQTSLIIDGEFIIIRGLHIKEASPPKGAEALITLRNKDREESNNCRISNLFFEDCNPEDLSKNYPWIRMYGHNNRIDHCRFTGQEHKGRAIQVRVYQPDSGHRIDHNYFGDRPPGLESNGYEIIQIGLSSDSMKLGNVIVEQNIFARCDGETEIISSKSCSNIIRNNLFLECSGSITLRHGDFAVVENNAFVGKGKEASGGIRVVARGNRVKGNYFSGLSGRTGGIIVLYSGIPDSPLNGYFAADEAILEGNIFYANSGNSIHLTGGFGQRNRILLPENVEINGNVFGRGTTGGTVALSGYLPDVEIQHNYNSGGFELGLAPSGGFIDKDIRFTVNRQGLFEPHMDVTEENAATSLPMAPSLPRASEVGPSWRRTLPSFLLLNEYRLLNLSGNRSDELQQQAEDILEKGCIYSVTTNDRLPPSGNKHDYYSTGPYWWPNPDTADGLPYINIDGKFNPERDIVSDRDPLLGMIHDVQAMALAYATSGDRRFSDWGSKLLRIWFLDEETLMRPNLNHAQAIPGRNDGRGRGIIDTHSFVELVDAMLILQNSSSMSPEESSSLNEWFREYTEWLLHSKNGLNEQAAVNNHGTAYDMQVAALLWFTGQEQRLKEYLEQVSLPRLAAQIEPDGSQPHELARTRTWSYCTENLEHFFKLALIARKVDLDLFNYRAKSGSGLKRALDYLLPYVCDPEGWAHPQKTAWQNGFIHGVLSIAAGVYSEDAYSASLQCLGEENDLHPFLLYPDRE